MKILLNKFKKWSLFKKTLSIVLSALIVTQAVFVVPIMVMAETSANNTTSALQDGININIKKTLTDVGNTLYKLSFDSSSYVKNNYQTYSRQFSEDGYFVADASGYYLIELWGGTGGQGADTLLVANNSGDGGSAGYVYGYVWMKKNETLVYTIGTNGTTVSTLNFGGGANGDGGEHGDDGSHTVGTGGGFSAVYLFNETRDSISMTTKERLTNYILIAGGGGGGGGNAANGIAEGKPNGGTGGRVTSSLSGTLTTTDNSVPGTYFRGSNGSSSGTSTRYVGRGGSSVPGASVETMGGQYSSETGNDWTGTYNTKYSYGAGGDGNLRGGGGGAGFCGGSGGIMEALLSPFAIGGGGGGSSFIADSVTYTNLSNRVQSYLHGANANINATNTGGACVISYLGDTTNDVTSTDHLESCVLSGTISTYFDIESVQTYSNGTATVSGQTITVSGINILPTENGYVGNTSTIDVFLRPKTGFAGGNNVPIIGDVFSFTPTGKSSINVDNNSATDYCNVPLMFKASPKSYMIMADELPKTYVRADLYIDEYTNRSNLTSYWQYDFISNISTYSVYAEGSTSAMTTNVNITTVGKHNFKVAFTVTPKNTTPAVVGTPVEYTEFHDTASITVVSADAAGTLNDLQVDATKLLSHDGENYNFAVEVNQKTDKIFVPAENLKNNTIGNGNWTARATGWYYIQTWGGNGGGAGASTASQKVNGSTTGSSASGGSGGYYSGYIFLEEGDMLYYTVGSNGNYGSGRSVTASGYNNYQYARGSGGGGGTYSSISLSENSDYLLIAGGGGGAGGSAAAVRGGWGLITGATWLDSANARAGASSSVLITDTSDLTAFNGTAGTNGTAGSQSSFPYVWATAGTAGKAGSNYRLSGLTTGYDTTGTAKPLSDAAKQYAANISAAKTNSNGQINITLIETPESRAELDKIYDLSADGTFSRYFDIKDISVTADSAATVTFNETITENFDHSNSWQITNLSFIPNITFTEDTVEGISGYYITYSSGLTILFKMQPKDGFIGGNDVPLVHYGTQSETDTGLRISQGEDSLWLKKSNTEGSARDLANVDINYQFEDNNFTTQNQTIICGESVNQADLIVNNNIPLPTGDEAWKAEFVKVLYPQTTTVSPTETTSYTFTQTVVPKADAVYATVIPQVNQKTLDANAAVFVEYTINNDGLVHTEYVGPDKILDGEDLNAIITAEYGYDMPTEIVVTVGGATLESSQYSYDVTTGELTISESKITGNVMISATSLPKEYTLCYQYPEIDDDGNYILDNFGNVKMLEHSEQYTADQAINLDWYNAFSAPEKIGHEFTWDWATEDGMPLSVMPAQNYFVVGCYTPITYTLTINYYKQGTSEALTDSYSTQLTYMSDYSVVSPAIDGYTPDRAAVVGSLSSDTIINVYYTPNDGKLTVFYIYGDSSTEVKDRLVIDLATDETYTVDGENIPYVTGYSPSETSVTVTMPATDGINVYIYYTPNTYTVTFDAAGGALAEGEESKAVVYNNIYGYNTSDNSYGALPQPMRNGFEFVGWKDKYGNSIDEESVVSISDDHVLTASWKAYTFKLTVYYQYSDGNEAQPTVVETHEYGAEFKVVTPEITGYTPDIVEVNGTIGSGNRVVFVTYHINIYSITVHYVGPNGEPMSEIDSSATDYYGEQEYNSEYSITSPIVPGYTAETELVTGVVGTNDIDITVNYEYIDYTLTVNYVLTDGPATQPESYVQNNLHIGDSYSVDTPVIDGYTPSQSTISGVVGTDDIILTVSYTRNSYKVNINYLYGDDIIDTSLSGGNIATPISATVSYGDEYSYTSPVIDGYAATQDVVSGTMGTEDITVTVYYNQTVSVTVEWGDMMFDYNFAEWDSATHIYNIPPATANTNYVSVTNDETSTLALGVDITYTANAGFESVEGYFTLDGDTQPLESTHNNLSVGENIKYWLWLHGIMPEELDFTNDTQTTGVCTVTIGGAD